MNYSNESMSNTDGARCVTETQDRQTEFEAILSEIRNLISDLEATSNSINAFANRTKEDNSPCEKSCEEKTLSSTDFIGKMKSELRRLQKINSRLSYTNNRLADIN